MSVMSTDRGHELKRSLRVLAAAAWHPSLRSVLLIDAQKSQIDLAAKAVERLLEAATGTPIKSVHLTVYRDEDDLWGRAEGLGPPWPNFHSQ